MRTDTTRGVPSICTVAIALPAYIGRLKVLASTMLVTSDAMPAPRRAAMRGRRSLPSAVADATTVSAPFCFATSAMAAV